MLSSISPVGELARRQRWAVTVSAYTTAAVAAGALTGTVLGAVGGLLVPTSEVGLGLLGAGAVVGLVADATVGVPTLHRQVDQRWLSTYRGWVYGAGYGAQLGTGVATIIPASIVWVMWLAAMACASPTSGALVGGVFALARSMPVLVAGRVRSVAALQSAMRTMDRRRASASMATRLGQAVVAAVAGAVLLG